MKRKAIDKYLYVHFVLHHFRLSIQMSIHVEVDRISIV